MDILNGWKKLNNTNLEEKCEDDTYNLCFGKKILTMMGNPKYIKER